VIRIASELGKGTTVELLLPAAPPTVTITVAATVAPKSNPALAQSCNILLVEDDPIVADTAANMLEDLGHRVTIASSAGNALDLLAADGKIDLVITDYAMPGMTGKELGNQIRKLHPRLPIVLASGYAELLDGGDGAGFKRLDKPYSLEKLAAMIDTTT